MKKSTLTFLFLMSVFAGIQAQTAGMPADTTKIYRVIDKMPGGTESLPRIEPSISCDSREIRSPGKSRHEIYCWKRREYQEFVGSRLQNHRL